MAPLTSPNSSFSSSTSSSSSSASSSEYVSSSPKKNLTRGRRLRDHDDSDDWIKAKSKRSPKKKKKLAKKPEKEPKEMKRKKEEDKKNQQKEQKVTGALIIPGSSIQHPPPDKTKYIIERYTGSKVLTEHDLFEIADLEHQHRKLNEALNELMDPGSPNILSHQKLIQIFGSEKKAKLAKLTADKRAPVILLDSAKVDLGVETLPELGPNTYPLIRYINEAPFFELHTLQPEDLRIVEKQEEEEEDKSNGGNQKSAKRVALSPGQVLGFADEETMSLSKVIYEFLLNFQKEQRSKE